MLLVLPNKFFKKNKPLLMMGNEIDDSCIISLGFQTLHTLISMDLNQNGFFSDTFINCNK